MAAGFEGQLGHKEVSFSGKTHLAQCSATPLAAGKRRGAGRVNNFPGLHNNNDDKRLQHPDLRCIHRFYSEKEESSNIFCNILGIVRTGKRKSVTFNEICVKYLAYKYHRFQVTVLVCLSSGMSVRPLLN